MRGPPASESRDGYDRGPNVRLCVIVGAPTVLFRVGREPAAEGLRPFRRMPVLRSDRVSHRLARPPGPSYHCSTTRDEGSNIHMIQAEARIAWHTLESKLRPFVARRVPSPADADDVLQDLFLRMQKGLPQLREEERFGPWVYQVARSAIAEHHRQMSRHPLPSGQAPDEPATSPEPDESAAESELSACISLFVAVLPSPYREALMLTELEGRTQAEAAHLLGLTVSGMKSRVQRGRARLREAFEECCEIALDARGRVISCERRSEGRLPKGCCES